MGQQLTFDDFIDRLRKADDRLLKTLRKKLLVIALKAEREAKKNATDYPMVRTGRLRSSITATRAPCCVPVATAAARPFSMLNM